MNLPKTKGMRRICETVDPLIHTSHRGVFIPGYGGWFPIEKVWIGSFRDDCRLGGFPPQIAGSLSLSFLCFSSALTINANKTEIEMIALRA